MFRFLIPLTIAALLVLGCDEKSQNKDVAAQAVESSAARANAFARASAQHPLPRTENFPMREALVKYTERQDLVNHPWYIYIVNEFLGTYQYFVGQTYPQSTCNFLSSTEATVNPADGASNTVVLTAPSLDGVYYGGGGSSGGGCDYFFFDAATDAMQVIHHDTRWFVSDSPLAIDAEKIVVAE